MRKVKRKTNKLRALRMLRSKGALGREKCPAEVTRSVVAEKWKLLVLRELLCGPVRFGALRRNLPSISAKVLAQKLGDLVGEGLIFKGEVVSHRSGAQYSLTAEGQSLAPVILEMHKWGNRRQRRTKGSNDQPGAVD